MHSGTLALLLALLAAPATGLAQTGGAAPDTAGPAPTRVELVLTAEEAVTSRTVRVEARARVARSRTRIDEARTLSIAGTRLYLPGDWRVTGLQHLMEGPPDGFWLVDLAARVDQRHLVALEQPPRGTPPPGVRVEIAAIDARPSDREIAAARTVVRRRLYREAEEERVELSRASNNRPVRIVSIEIAESGLPEPTEAVTAAETLVLKPLVITATATVLIEIEPP